MTDDSHQFDSSVRDGIFDGSADDIADLSHPDFADDYHFSGSRRRSRRGYQDLSGAPSWVKAFVWAGALLAIAGFGVVLFSVLGPSGAPQPRSLTPAFPTAVTFGDVPPDFADGYQLPPGFPNQPLPPEFQTFETPGFPQRPTVPSVGGPNLGLGFGLFFAGFVLTAIGALGHSTSTRR
ncbi:hypothetical protein ACSHWB_23095 [Lentzea sp. HUAS TT2]|uniref:hypothetical protein n=1 Tax=Lentzea sp. HUAS TT2 TaxID=3447454 RepID=UPI003F6F41E1